MRCRKITLGVLAASVSAFIPVSLILLVAWQTRIQHTQERIDYFAELLVNRADRVAAQVTETLKTLSALQMTPCSPEHIMHMRQMVFQTIPIDKTAYFENGAIRCSSWEEITDRDIGQHQTDFVTSDGVAVATQVASRFSEDDPAMLLTYGSYGVYINASRFVDIIAEENMQLALAAFNGAVVAATTPSLNDFFHRIIADPDGAQTPQYLHSVAQKGDWIAAVIKPKRSLFQYLEGRSKLAFSITGITGLPVFALVLYLFLKRPSLRARLRLAIRNKEFQVCYQPIIDSRTGRCSGAEALLRWQWPDGSMIRPDIFIPLAEESGQIKPITDLLIEIVAQEMQEALVANRQLHIALNLCADDVRTGRVLPVISDRFAKAGISSEQIWLEVTEHGILDIDSARLFLDKAREQGHTIAIDDFGTGYSNLKYLQDLPVDVLKIDRAFVASIGTGSAASTVVSHIIDMAKSLKLTIVAEGVETQEQADYLAARGVEFMQGWLYYKALPIEEFLDVASARGS